MLIPDLPVPGHPGDIQRMLFLMCAVQKPDDDLVTGIRLQQRRCRVSIDMGTENICRIIPGRSLSRIGSDR